MMPRAGRAAPGLAAGAPTELPERRITIASARLHGLAAPVGPAAGGPTPNRCLELQLCR